MDTPRSFERTMMVLLAWCSILANILLSLGCTQIQESLGIRADEQPRYPALVVTEPNFTRNGETGNISLNLGVIETSDSELWLDFIRLARKANFWRVSVVKASTEEPVDYFDWVPTENDKDLKNKTTKDLKNIPLETLMRVYADFSSGKNPDDDNAVHTSRTYLFLLHKTPD